MYMCMYIYMYMHIEGRRKRVGCQIDGYLTGVKHRFTF